MSLKKVFANLTKSNILTAPFIEEMCSLTSNMYSKGWDERNGGNISYLLTNEEVEPYLDLEEIKRVIPLNFDASGLKGKIFLVTGTGKYFKNVENDPENNLGIIRISDDGKNAELLWGYSDGGKFTSELPSHLMSHATRLRHNPKNRIILHTHPTNILAMGFVHELDDKKMSHTLWQMCTECIVVFPDGVGVLPWMVCGNDTIGVATAKKFEEFRVVVWGLHGIYGAGESFDEAFGLVETVEKAAELYMKIAHLPRINTITDQDLDAVAKAFNIEYRKDFLGE